MDLDARHGRGVLSRPAHRQTRLPLDAARLPLRAPRVHQLHQQPQHYGWDRICEKYFGTHPAKVFFDWNIAPHVQEYDGRPTKRPYTHEEISALFDHADDEVARIGKSGRKGWQPAYRDAVMMKTAYAYGLRLNELRHLLTVDFARNPHAREFGPFGVCKVRYGKARRGSPHKPRSVLTVWRWTPGILEDWLANGRGEPGTLDLFPSERGGLVVESTLIRLVRRYCEELGFSDGLDLHSFRRSYATHLLEAGWEARQAEASVVFEDETVVVFMDLNPVTPGHLLVVPREHAVGLEDLDGATSAHVWSVGHDMSRALRRSGMRCEGINVFLCDGEATFQTVPTSTFTSSLATQETAGPSFPSRRNATGRSSTATRERSKTPSP